MSSRHSNRSRLLSVLAAIVPTGAALAQQIPIDNFDDRNDAGWLHWVSDDAYPGVYSMSNQRYCLSTADVVPANVFTIVYSEWVESQLPAFSEGFLRATVRNAARDSNPGLVMRFDLETVTGYAFVADGDNGDLVVLRNNGGNQETLGFSPSAFRVDQDWHFEAGAVGAQLSFKAWRVGTPEPEPQIVFVDKEPVASGRMGVAVAHPIPSIASRISACFDDVVFRPACPADFNLDGAPNSQDFFDFIAAFFALEPRADFNTDGVINSQDFFDFLGMFFAGC